MKSRIQQLEASFKGHRESNRAKEFMPQISGKFVNLQVGIYDKKYAIGIVGDVQKLSISDTYFIKIKKLILNNTLVGVAFVLEDDSLLEIFVSFAYDLEMLIKENPEVSVSQVYNRYVYWQKMFTKQKNNIGEAIIKGLINELYLLDRYFIPTYGANRALEAWIGPEKAHKDFAFSNGLWFESKAINAGKESVQISSLEQLDAEMLGYLAISELEKTAKDNKKGEFLRKIFLSIVDKEIQVELLDKFFNKINEVIGLNSILDEKNEVNEYCYLVKSTKFYAINEGFPVLKRESLPKAVTSVKYNLIISDLEDFNIGFEKIAEEDDVEYGYK